MARNPPSPPVAATFRMIVMTDTNPAALAGKLREQFGELVSAPSEFRGESSVVVADAERIAEVCAFAKESLGFDYLVDLSTVDNYGDDPRWLVVYELRGLGHGCCLRDRKSTRLNSSH